MQRLKALKASYIEGIATLKQLFEGSMARLELVLQHYSAVEKALSQHFIDKRLFEFKYDPNTEIEQINLELGKIITAYFASKDRKTVEERIMAETTATSEKVQGLLKSLTESFRSKVEDICGVRLMDLPL